MPGSSVRKARLPRALVLVAALLALAVPLARADAPLVSPSRSNGPPTAPLTLNGSGFGSNEEVEVYFDSTDLGAVSTGDSGSFAFALRVPQSAQPGFHTLMAIGQASGLSAQARFLV